MAHKIIRQQGTKHMALILSEKYVTIKAYNTHDEAKSFLDKFICFDDYVEINIGGLYITVEYKYLHFVDLDKLKLEGDMVKIGDKYLHQLVLSIEAPEKVKFCNGDMLDYRMLNLRIVY